MKVINRKMVFRQRLNVARKAGHQINLQLFFQSYEATMSCVEYKDLSSSPNNVVNKDSLCESFSVSFPLCRNKIMCIFNSINIFQNYGWCSQKSCKKLHDVDAILDVEEAAARKKKRKRNHKKNLSENGECQAIDESRFPHTDLANGMHGTGEAPDEQSQDKTSACLAQISLSSQPHAETTVETIKPAPHSRTSSTHRASCDAFMTGFIMATYIATLAPPPEINSPFILNECSGAFQISNRIFLSGKDQPLIIQKSNFTSTSKAHQQKKL